MPHLLSGLGSLWCNRKQRFNVCVWGVVLWSHASSAPSCQDCDLGFINAPCQIMKTGLMWFVFMSFLWWIFCFILQGRGLAAGAQNIGNSGRNKFFALLPVMEIEKHPWVSFEFLVRRLRQKMECQSWTWCIALTIINTTITTTTIFLNPCTYFLYCKKKKGFV